jgi:hypothetical protein
MVLAVRGTTMAEQAERLTPEQKRRKRFADWLKTGIIFDSLPLDIFPHY